MTEREKILNSLGNNIGEIKKRLFDRIKAGADLKDAISVFIAELTLALEMVARGDS